MVKVLITGASGFIGFVLCEWLKNNKIPFYGASSKEGDISSPATWRKFPAAEVVVHMAGRSFVPESWNCPADFLNTNVLGTQYALDYCKRNGSKMVFISAYTYGIPEQLPISEKHPVKPSNPYALSKHLAEQLCEFSVLNEQVRSATVLRLFNVYGLGQREEFLIPSILNNVTHAREIKVFDLKPRRDYVYIDDVISAITSAMSLEDGFYLFNIGSGVSYSVKEVVEIIQRVAGTQLPVTSNNQVRLQEIPDVRADCSRAQTILGWRPLVSFEQGIINILQQKAKDE